MPKNLRKRLTRQLDSYNQCVGIHVALLTLDNGARDACQAVLAPVSSGLLETADGPMQVSGMIRGKQRLSKELPPHLLPIHLHRWKQDLCFIGLSRLYFELLRRRPTAFRCKSPWA